MMQSITTSSSLPFPLINASAFVDSKQTFAAIIGGSTAGERTRGVRHSEHGEVVPCIEAEKIPNQDIIIFTITKGFELVKNFKLSTDDLHHMCLQIQ